MESTPFLRPTTPFTSSSLLFPRKIPVSLFPIFPTNSLLHTPQRLSALKSPRGFGAPPKKTNKKRKKRGADEADNTDSDDDDDHAGPYEDTIPEIVTNRMMRRMGFSVGIPVVTGLMFFPLFYYLKVIAKVDVPTWLPVIVSFFFFGTALLGVSYGIVSSSWDPLREGSFLGWKEAQKNWPVFWQSLWGRKSSKY